jgi:hypothetical protein
MREDALPVIIKDNVKRKAMINFFKGLLIIGCNKYKYSF